jgi:hypothetical protein
MVGAITLAALTPFGSAPASATPASQLAAAAPIEIRATTLVAGKKNLLGMNLKPTATLTDTVTGEPLVGHVVLFYLRNSEWLPPMCGGVTNALGVATCGGMREQMFVLQARGYRASSNPKEVGNIYYRSSTDEVGLFGS